MILLQSSKSVKWKPLRLAFFFILAFTLLAASVSAVNIAVSNFQAQDSAVVGDRFYKVTVKVSGTGSVEQGIVELGLSDKSNIPFLAISESRQPCEATFPWNTHAYYKVGILGGYDSVTFTLTGRGIPDGTYYPIITHATGCFNAGAEPKEPYGYGKRITPNPVIFGDRTGNVNDQCDNPYTALQWVLAKGDTACIEATCFNPSSTSSEARCVKRAECANGAEQWSTCGDGSSIAVRSCVGGAWQTTGQNCPGDDEPLPPRSCASTPTPPNCKTDTESNLGGIFLLGGIVLVAGYFGLILLRKSGLLKV